MPPPRGAGNKRKLSFPRLNNKADDKSGQIGPSSSALYKYYLISPLFPNHTITNKFQQWVSSLYVFHPTSFKLLYVVTSEAGWQLTSNWYFSTDRDELLQHDSNEAQQAQQANDQDNQPTWTGELIVSLFNHSSLFGTDDSSFFYGTCRGELLLSEQLERTRIIVLLMEILALVSLVLSSTYCTRRIPKLTVVWIFD